MLCQPTADWPADQSDLRSKKRRNTDGSNNLASGASECELRFHRKHLLLLTPDRCRGPEKERKEKVVTENGKQGDG